MRLVAPEHRRQRTFRRSGKVRREDAEELADSALGREVRQPDRAAGPADPEQFVRDGLMVGREHGAERGRDDVELAVRERQRLRVGDDPLDLDTSPASLLLAGRETLRRQVGGDDVRARLGRADRDVAGAGGDVEHVLPGLDPAGLGELRADTPHHLLREPVIVAERPDRARRRLLILHLAS